MAYPDCEEILLDIYKMKVEETFVDKRKYNVDGYQKGENDEELVDSTKAQCSWVNFPQDLDAIEYMDMLGGPFHVSDYYTIHHD